MLRADTPQEKIKQPSKMMVIFITGKSDPEILMQRHRFQNLTTSGSIRYEITIGAYWLDTMQRWQTPSGTDVVAQLLLGP